MTIKPGFGNTAIINAVAFLIGIILILLTSFRFGLDINIQTAAHLIFFISFILLLNYYKISIPPALLIPCAMFLFSALLTLPFSEEKASVRSESLVLADAMAGAFLMSLLSREKKEKLLLMSVLAAFFIAVVLIASFILNPSVYISTLPLPKELIVNFSIISGYLVICLPISFFFWNNGPRHSKIDAESMNYYGLVLSGIIFWGILLTLSRSAAIAAFIAIFFFFGKKRRVIIFAAAAILYIYLLSIFKYSQQEAFQSFFFENRIEWWKTAIRMFYHNPVLGIGWGNFANLYPVYRDSGGLSAAYAHNIFLQVLAQNGVAGLLSFLLLIYYSFKKGIVTDSYLSLALACFLMVNFFDYSFFVPAPMFLFFMFIGAFYESSIISRPTPVISLYAVLPAAIIISLPLLLPAVSNMHYENARVLLADKKTEAAEKEFILSTKYDNWASAPYGGLAELYFLKYSMTKDRLFISKALAMQNESLKRFHSNAAAWSDLAWLYSLDRDNNKSRIAITNALRYDRFNKTYAAAARSLIHGELNEHPQKSPR